MTAFEKAMAHVGGTPQGRAVSATLNFGMEGDVQGFFALDVDESQFWAAVTGVLPEIRGTYIVDNKGLYHLDLASSVSATPTALTITIRPDAVWFSPGHGTTPVTADDYAYTYNVITDARNPVASTTGYSNINPTNPYKIVDAHKIIFHFSTPFVDYRDLFGYILPSDYLPSVAQMGANNGAIFNQVWRDCVCTQTVSGGNVVDGDPVTDGPFYLDSYTQGQGVVIKRTPQAAWYGHFAGLTQINFPIVTPGATEVNALQGGQLDAAYPTPSAALASACQNDGNLVCDVKNDFVQEHWDFNQANPNLAHPWMRRAIALGMNRPALIKAVYTDTIAPGLKELNNPVYEIGPNATGLHAYFRVWNYDPTHALTILKNHCTGGPDAPSSNNTKIWTCPDGKASFDWYSTALDARVKSGQIFKAQLQSIGIELVTHNIGSVDLGTILRGAQTNSCVTNNPCGAQTYDIAEYAVVGGVDPSGVDAIYECYDGHGRGSGNYKNYCNPTIDSLLNTANRTIDAATRTSLYEKVAKIVSNKAYIVPLYGRPVILVHNARVHGMENSNNPFSGPTWNAEQWHF